MFSEKVTASLFPHTYFPHNLLFLADDKYTPKVVFLLCKVILKNVILRIIMGNPEFYNSSIISLSIDKYSESP